MEIMEKRMQMLQHRNNEGEATECKYIVITVDIKGNIR
jgi:hypothetical protein